MFWPAASFLLKTRLTLWSRHCLNAKSKRLSEFSTGERTGHNVSKVHRLLWDTPELKKILPKFSNFNPFSPFLYEAKDYILVDDFSKLVEEAWTIMLTFLVIIISLSIFKVILKSMRWSFKPPFKKSHVILFSSYPRKIDCSIHILQYKDRTSVLYCPIFNAPIYNP